MNRETKRRIGYIIFLIVIIGIAVSYFEYFDSKYEEESKAGKKVIVTSIDIESIFSRKVTVTTTNGTYIVNMAIEKNAIFNFKSAVDVGKEVVITDKGIIGETWIGYRNRYDFRKE